MSATINLKRKHIGKLLVISRASNVGNRARWKCRCDCGKEKIIWACNLLTKASKSCGCGWSKPKSKNPCWKGFGELGGRQFGEVIAGARKRNITFNLSIQYLWKLFLKQNKKCSLSGINLTMDKYENKKAKPGTASVDRIDNNKGYINGNVQWVHKDINWMKQDFTQQEFINYCHLIAKTHEPKN